MDTQERLQKILSNLENAGWLITGVDDGGTTYSINGDNTLLRIDAAMEVINSVDDSTVYVKREKRNGWVLLILSNEQDMVSDYTTNIDDSIFEIYEPEYTLQRIGSIGESMENGSDEYILVKSDQEIDLQALKAWIMPKWYRECSGPGQYFCTSCSAVHTEYDEYQAIVTIHHRYDI